MRKPPLQDVIVKPSRRSTPDEGVRRRRAPAQHEENAVPIRRDASAAHPEHDYDEDQSRRVRHRISRPLDEPPVLGRDDMFDEGDPHRKKWLIVALGIGAIVILSSVALSLLFAGATVTVYPLQDKMVASAQFTAEQEGAGGALPFERIVVERTASQSVVALGEDEVEERAFGNITIFNEYSDAPQRLIKRTRFESSEGRIYRIADPVEVPGMNSDGTPGTIEVTVYAEEPGEDYNMGPDTFSIPGFVGLPPEGKIYAKSTEALAGGFVGVKRTVGEAERQQALTDLESQLRDELRDAAFSDAEQPDGYHLFKEAIFYEFNSLPDELVEQDKVTVSLTGKLHGLLFKEDVFAQRLAEQTLGNYEGAELYIDNPDDLIVQVTAVDDEDNQTANVPWQATTYDVSVEGTTHFIWEFDPTSFAEDLAGKDKVILQMPVQGGLLEAYPGIDRAAATIRPFWKKTFPESAEDIVVITELDA